MRLVIIGCGYSARAFLRRHGSRFAAVTGTATEARSVAELRAGGIDALLFDGGAVASELAARLAAASHLLLSAPPGEAGDPLLAAGRAALDAADGLAWIGYLSTLGVYGGASGERVDETSPLVPRHGRAARRVLAEEAWLAYGRERGAATQVFRLAGIYGPGEGRNAFARLADGTARRIIKPGQVFNRIHVDDIADAVAAGIDHPDAGPIFNVCDDEPAPPQDLITFAAGLIGVAPPPEEPFETAAMSEMAKSFYATSHRASNALLKRETGWRPRYPTYREGLPAVLAAERAAAAATGSPPRSSSAPPR